MIVDYILFNSDRHTGNWGVWFNADTGEILGLHPLFDHNLCLKPNADNMSKVIEGKTLEECARYAKSKVRLDMRKLIAWLKRKDTKLKIRKIDLTGKYYRSLLKRIEAYESW